MRLYIIQPSYYTDPVSRKLFRTKRVNLVPLTLPHLAALVPEGIDVRITDEKTRPVEVVVEEIRSVNKKRFFFADSTLAGSRTRTMKMMERLIPLNIRWSALWTANRVLDPELMALARRSGLLHLNLGIESIKQETLDGMNKRTTRADRLKEVIQRLHELGISYSFNLIFGWDMDRESDFRDTLEFLKKNKVHTAFFNSFAPYKGTNIYDHFKAEDRILNPENMDRWPGIHAKIHPKNFSPATLEQGIRSICEDFCSWSSMLRRLPLPLNVSSFASWSVNLSQRRFVFGKGTNFDNY